MLLQLPLDGNSLRIFDIIQPARKGNMCRGDQRGEDKELRLNKTLPKQVILLLQLQKIHVLLVIP